MGATDGDRNSTHESPQQCPRTMKSALYACIAAWRAHTPARAHTRTYALTHTHTYTRTLTHTYARAVSGRVAAHPWHTTDWYSRGTLGVPPQGSHFCAYRTRLRAYAQPIQHEIPRTKRPNSAHARSKARSVRALQRGLRTHPHVLSRTHLRTHTHARTLTHPRTRAHMCTRARCRRARGGAAHPWHATHGYSGGTPAGVAFLRISDTLTRIRATDPA
jgi:hypothetical protein